MATPGTDAGAARGEAGALPVATVDAEQARPRRAMRSLLGFRLPAIVLRRWTMTRWTDHEPDSDAAAPMGAATVWGGVAKERFGVAHFRDERAGWRDHAALERDELAAGRDLEADGDDQTALALEGVDGLLDRGTLGLGQLRERGLAGRSGLRWAGSARGVTGTWPLLIVSWGSATARSRGATASMPGLMS